MIDYFKGIYGLNLLFRVHGSALYKGSLVGIISVLFFLAIQLQWNTSGNRRDMDENGNHYDDLDHPYGVGVLVSSVSFLIVFRANYGYQRFWEACGAVNHFMSKWMDATQHTAVFHMQNSNYDEMRPPSFFDHEDLNKLNLTMDRQPHTPVAKGDFEGTNKSQKNRLKSANDVVKPSGMKPSIDRRDPNHRFSTKELMKSPAQGHGHSGDFRPPDSASTEILHRIETNSKYFPSATHPNQNFADRPNSQTPPLFLQELAHLSSLLCAVALSTLRNDLDDKESPLDIYVPGAPWPVSDPDKLPKATKSEFHHDYAIVRNIRYWFGIDRKPKSFANYIASRPMLIIGGISNAEIAHLQKARGSYAKTQLAFHWLSEFIIREHLSGSLGEVHAAIISRLVQFMSDGMLYYNHARKIMYIPFPFPHAQLSAFFTIIMVPTIPFLLDQYTNGLWMGCMITFFTVTCLVGLHEVARELENPFRNVPNEIPLCTIHAMYNEALVTMFSGYNPDSFWDAEMYQGALEALAMGKIREVERSMEEDNTTAASESLYRRKPPQDISDEAEKSRPKTVRFASNLDNETDSEHDDAEELRKVLEKQALEIEELVRLLDEEDAGDS
ncbi:hypothetical protein ACHAXS_007631 [Conticribra weissflogii]